MSVDIYCHWEACCILQGTAAFPIGQLYCNGQQMHNDALMEMDVVLGTEKSFITLGMSRHNLQYSQSSFPYKTNFYVFSQREINAAD